MNLNCKSTQKRLATQWGFVPAQQPLTDDQLFDVFEGKDSEIWWQFDFGRFQMVARAIERAAAEIGRNMK